MNPTRLAGWSASITRRICLTLVLGLIGSWAALAQVAVGAAVHAKGWKSVGPAPPTVAAPIAALPAFRTIYLNTRGGGLFKSTNGGSSFVGLENSIRGASSLAVDPRDPNVVYVGGSQVDRRRRNLELHGGRRRHRAGHGSLESGRPLWPRRRDSEDRRCRRDLVLGGGGRPGARFPRDQSVRHGRALRRHPGRRRVQVRRRRSQLEPDRHRLDRVVAARRSEQRQHRLCRVRTATVSTRAPTEATRSCGSDRR